MGSGLGDGGWQTVKRSRDKEPRVGGRFLEFLRLLRGLQPRAFVAENVPSLAAGRAKGLFKQILSELEASGYRVSARIINAAWLGVPQSRERLVFVRVRNDLGIDPPMPGPLTFSPPHPHGDPNP